MINHVFNRNLRISWDLSLSLPVSIAFSKSSAQLAKGERKRKNISTGLVSAIIIQKTYSYNSYYILQLWCHVHTHIYIYIYNILIIQYHNISKLYHIWLVVDLRLWQIWVRQLGWRHSQLNGQIKLMFQSRPASIYI